MSCIAGVRVEASRWGCPGHRPKPRAEARAFRPPARRFVTWGVATAVAVGGFSPLPAYAQKQARVVAAQVAPGCPTDRPTAIGGAIFGYPDNRSVDAIIGMDLKNSAGQKVDIYGRAITTSGYSYVDRVNPTLTAEGSTGPGWDRHWGAASVSADLCVSGAITEGFFEIYPKDPSGTTDKIRYGEASHYYQPITPGGNNQIGLRLPARVEVGGNTGYVNGYLSFGGHRIPPGNITRVRAFTHGRGPECGVEGLAASADQLGYSTSLDATYYRIDALAGGRCGAPTQRYTLYIDCTDACGPGTRTASRVIDIATARGIRVDIGF